MFGYQQVIVPVCQGSWVVDPVSDASVVVEKHVTACYRMEPESTERLFMFAEESTGGSQNPSLYVIQPQVANTYRTPHTQPIPIE